MPITPYLRPQDTITQILRQTTAPAVARRNPVVIGPQYELFLNDGRDLSKHSFLTAGGALAYERGNGSALDLVTHLPFASGVKMFGENLEAKVADFDSGGVFIREGSTVDSIRLDPAVIMTNLAGPSLHAYLTDRSVKVGDVFAVSIDGGTPVRRTVVARLPRVTPAVAAASLSKSGAATNVVTGTLGAVFVSGSSGWTTAAATAATVAPYLANGGKVTSGASTLLGEQFSIVCTTGGAPGTAQFIVTPLTTGVASTLITSSAPGGNVYGLNLTAAGYTGTTITITRTDAVAVVGHTIVVKVYPAYTAPVPAALVTVAGTYTGTVDRRYVIEVTTGHGTLSDVRLRTFDTAGSDALNINIAGNATIPLGLSGLNVTLSDIDLYKGAKYYVDAIAAVTSTTEFNGVKLSGPILNAATYVAEPITVDIFQRYTGELTADNSTAGTTAPFTATATGVNYISGLGLSAADAGTTGFAPFANGVGEVLLSYKAAVIPGALEGAIAITSATTMASLVGEANIENWLGRGVFEAFSGNQSQRVYALRTLDDSVESFTAALQKIRTTDVYYALAIMSDNTDVMELAVAHVEEMSNKFNKNFRRCYVGTDSPGEYVVWGELPGGGYRLATLVSGTVSIEEEFRDQVAFSEADIGSFITLVGIAGRYPITAVYSAHEVAIIIANATVAAAVGFTLIRNDTAANTVRFVNERAALLDNRRCVSVWSDRPTYAASSGNETIPMKFAAAEIAGIRCALLPQQGLTMTEIRSLTAAPAMYTRFTPEQLDEISSNGTMVVTQESDGGDIFIRHQLTTRTSDGALAYEDNIGVIVDTFAYSEKDTFRSYIGKRNATRNTIEDIRVKLKQLAIDATTIDIVNEDIGPMVIRFFDEDGVEGEVTVRLDGVLADHILTYVKLRVPLPLNGIDHYIDVETSVDL